jgi:hypothetical protein
MTGAGRPQALRRGYIKGPNPIRKESMAEQLIDKRERYVEYANNCLQLAKVIFDNQSRLLLKEMASEG